MTDDIELIDSTLPPIEDGGDHDGVSEVVAMGGRSVLAIAVVLALVVAALLSLGRRDDDPVAPSGPTVPLGPDAGRPGPAVELDVGTVPGDGPVLGRETGLSLLAGGPETPLRVLDLDSGDLTVSGIEVEPRFVSGSTLFFQYGDSTWARTRLGRESDPAPIETVQPGFRPGGEPAHIVPGERRVWLTWPRPDRRRDWQLIDVATLSVIRQVTTPVEARILGGDTAFSGPEVVGFTTGGVHELRSDGTYRRVLDGRLVAVATNEVLVRQCPVGSSCALRWFERGSWTLADLPSPEGDLVTGRLLAQDRLLAGTVGRFAFGAALFDVGSGERLRSLGPIPLGDVAISDDGDWLLRRLFGRVEVVDLMTGSAIEVPNFLLGAGDAVVWLDSR